MINNAALEIIKEFEGCKLSAYQCPAGVWTIGYGTTAAAGVGIEPKQGMVISQKDAEKYLRMAVGRFTQDIMPFITKPISPNELGAFVSLAYNIGVGAFKKSSALRYFNAGDKAKAADAILLWNKAGGKVLAGLTRRRVAERALFVTPAGFAAHPEMVDAKATPDTPRDTPMESTTMQAGALQMASAAGAGVSAVSALSGTAQIVALAFCGIVALAALWIMRERLRRWADGDR